MVVVLKADCQGEQVKVNGLNVSDAEIISIGKGQSDGVLFIFGDKSYYVTSSAKDLEKTLEKTIEAINKIGTTLTAIGAGMTGPTTAPPGTLATDVAELVAIAVELETLKGALR